MQVLLRVLKVEHEDLLTVVLRSVLHGLLPHAVEQGLTAYGGVHPGVVGDGVGDGQGTGGRAFVQDDGFVLRAGGRLGRWWLGEWLMLLLVLLRWE